LSYLITKKKQKKRWGVRKERKKEKTQKERTKREGGSEGGK